MKQILLVICLLISTSVMAEGKLVPNQPHIRVYQMCIGGYVFVVAASSNNLAITQLMVERSNSSRPQPKKCRMEAK